MRFTRAHRLVSKSDFQFVFDKPRKFSRQYLQILYRINTLPHPRLGILVSKHNLRLAVDRNRIRRIIRESFRAHQAGLGQVDVIVRLKRSCRGVDSSVIRDEIDGMWGGVQCHPPA